MHEDKLIGIDLSVASEEVISLLLDDPNDPSIFHEVYNANTTRPEVLKLLYEHRRTPEDLRKEVSLSLNLPVRAEGDLITTAEAEEETEEAQLQKHESILNKVQRLSVGEKIQLAIKGGKEIRNVLIRDPNKEVVLKVLENPKITETEVEAIARNPSAPEEALRYISKKRDWIRRYSIILALVSNPKTPPGVSMPFISRLRMNDLVILQRSKNIPEAVRNAIIRYIKLRKK
ncbi:MAG: hypothetical protein GXO97_05725 [Nitrospirae bacterium]|nr:hypothetical protein [Nitrospirota bacterium]